MKKECFQVTAKKFKEWVCSTNYESIYQLSPKEFAKQIALRCWYFSYMELEPNYLIKPKTIELILKGKPLLKESCLEEFNSSLELLKDELCEIEMRELSFKSGLKIAGTVLRQVDKKQLALNINEESKNDLDDLLREDSLLQAAILQNDDNEKFKDSSFDSFELDAYDLDLSDVISDYHPVYCELNLNTPKEQLLKQFSELIDTKLKERNRYFKQNENINTIIAKCKAYKVIETFDIQTINKIYGNKPTQKEIVFFLFECWTDDNFRKKTLKYSRIIFEPNFYSTYLNR